MSLESSELSLTSVCACDQQSPEACLLVSLVLLLPQMLGIPHDELLAVDKKPAAKQVMFANTKPTCHFEQMKDLENATAWCTRHRQACPVIRAQPCHLLVCGPPCTPYSQQRSTRKATRHVAWLRRSECASFYHIAFEERSCNLERERERETERERERERDRERGRQRA